MSIHNESENDIEKVSIITPCYNAEDYIKSTYKALKDQTISNWEWIVVDDCSTDDSYKILTELSQEDKRVKVFKNSENSGAAVTRNICLNNAKGRYLAFLDCDDLWKKDKLEKQIDFHRKNHSQFTYHDYELVDAIGVHIKNQVCPKKMTARDLLKFNPFATSSVFIDRDLIEKHQIRFKEHLRRRQDYLFWYDAIKASREAFGMPDVLSSYRLIGASSLSANKKKMAVIQWKLYRKEFGLNFISSCYYFFHYALHGIKKYFL